MVNIFWVKGKGDEWGEWDEWSEWGEWGDGGDGGGEVDQGDIHHQTLNA